MTTQKSSPRWPKLASKRVEHLVAEFKDNIRRIATRFAHHDRADNIDERHVDEAYEALVRLGLKRRVWWRRSELKVGVGTALISLALASPDFAPLLSDNVERQYTITIAVVIVLLLVGAFVCFLGWNQNRP